MTQAPERIWATGQSAQPSGRWWHETELKIGVKYIRADLVPQWQPIETAPKDGTEILTIRSNGYIRNAKWYDNPFGRKDTVIDDADGKWWSVTHWMPLPSPPA